ncbi:MAG: efflux RND transporter permease subunit, partial [Victivallales bacterium]|nr:efflux RND transporter permease subunit [Victivallales bacterium]
EKLNTIADDFPEAVETPQLSKVNINAIPVVTLFLTGDRSIDELYDYADDKLADRFSTLAGVGEVRIHGGNEVQLHVILDRGKLAASNLTVGDIVSRIKLSNLKLPAGQIEEKGREVSVTYDAEFRDIQSLKELEVSGVVGKRIYLGDIADIRLVSKKIRMMGYCNSEPGVQLEVVKKADANAVRVINAVRKRYDELVVSGALPGGMKLNWFHDNGDFIHACVEDSWGSVVAGILLTALLLFLFLHNPRSTFIISITMPVSITIAIGGIYLLGYTFDLISLVALGCSTGVLVTNSVVVMENIFKKLHAGASPEEAAATGTAEVINAVSASALTNVVVFVPVALMTTVVGLLISPFAGVMVIVTLASLFVSFTLTPILASVMFRKSTETKNRVFKKIFFVWNTGYDYVERSFLKTISFIRRWPGTVVVLAVLLCALIMVLVAPLLSLDFIPVNDRGKMSVVLEFPANTSLKAACEETLKAVEKIRRLPEVDATGATVGYINAIVGQISEGVHVAEIIVHLIPKSRRKSIWKLCDEIRREFARAKDMLVTVNIPNPTGSSGQQVVAYIKGPDFSVLREAGHKGLAILRKSGIASDVDSSMRTSKPRVNLLPVRPVLRNLGISESQLGTSVVGFFDGVLAGTYKVGTRTFDIRVKTNELENIEAAGNVVAASLNGEPVNLDTLILQESDPVSLSIIRQDKERSVWLYCNPANGATIGDLVKLLNSRLAAKLPRGYNLDYHGPAAMMEEGAADFADVFLSAVVMIYLLMAAIMESWSRPFLIMFTIPLGFIGMFAAIILAKSTLSMIALLGGVMMIGIVVNNAILIMDETAVLTQGGMNTHDAMAQALKNKFRPVVMTSIASVVGVLPLVFGTGIGSELRRNCGIGVVGGVLFSSVLTLYLIPALYFKFIADSALPPESFGKRLKRFLGLAKPQIPATQINAEDAQIPSLPEQ